MMLVDKMCGVYALLHRPSGKCYVGSSKNIKGRVHGHFSELLQARHHNARLFQAWVNSYPEEWSVLVLEQCEREALFGREQFYMDSLDSSLNIKTNAVGGDGSTWIGRRHLTSTRRKISLARMGKKLGPYSQEHRDHIAAGLRGKPLTAERRQKISLAMSGKKRSPRSEETKQKIRLASLKQRHTDETKIKMRLAKLGKPLSAEHRQHLKEAHQRRKQRINGGLYAD